MRNTLCLFVVIIAACAHGLVGQDDGEQRFKKALEGRHVLIKMDLPAIDTGVELFIDNTDVSFNATTYNSLLKEYGVAVKKGGRSRITDVRISGKGIEIDLDGGGLPGPDWIVGELRLVEPAPLNKSDREVELERQIQTESNMGTASFLRSEIEYERQRRITQDERNRQAFERVARLRSQYIEENRKNWGSKLIIVVRSRKVSVTMRDMVRSLAKYVELLPSEKPAQ
jgi:hypothetical protein